MQVTQSYARPSSTQNDSQGMKFDFSAELSRKPVSLNALIKNSLDYARLMLALRQVVKGDWRPAQKDHSAYQAWVTERYLEELPAHLQHIEAEKALLFQEREKLKIQQKKLKEEIQPIQSKITKSRYKYYEWLYRHDRDKWMVLDPVISVHPDAVIFEAFSLDESSYGRVSVPSNLLEIFGQVDYGTTNIDFSQALADEIYRVRSYRPAWLKVSFEQVELSTSAGANVEKKIDLPESWVRGFLQVQSASTFEGIQVSLEASTLAQILAVLESKKERESPRSIRIILKKGEKIRFILDPWNIEIVDQHIFKGDQEGEVKLWGRRRLLVFKDLLPYAAQVQVKLLGTGMPSYWTIELGGHRFDLGLSGWTANDWAKKGNFDLLASTGSNRKIDLKKVEQVLIQELSLKPEELAQKLKISRPDATAALQELAKSGQAMYDHLQGAYRWRQLLKPEIKIQENEEDERLKYAISLIKDKKVDLLNSQNLENQITEYKFGVQGKNTFYPVLQLDLDGRVKKAVCTCGFYRRNKLRQGPCPHMMAGAMYLSKYKIKS